MLRSSHPGFVNVLDLYSITASGAAPYVEIDISGKWAKLNETGKLPAAVYLTVVFRGNTLNGAESRRAGEFTVRGLSIVQRK